MQPSPDFSFNLLTEPWIPVVYRDGKYGRVGILKALTDAHLIWRIDTGNPLDTLALTRLLLAVLYWCQGNPPPSLVADPDSPFPNDWFDKVRDNTGLFELFSENGPRFYQDPGVRNKKQLPVMNLIHEIPSGHNFPHFLHVDDMSVLHEDGMKLGLSPAACAIGLARLPVFTTNGGRGKSYGINKTPPVYLMPESSSLAGTLRLSWAVLGNREPGVPAWENPLRPLQDKMPLLTGLTWLPRRVWLCCEPFEPPARCIFTGDTIGFGVRKMAFENHEIMKEKTYTWIDPHSLAELQSIDLFNLSKNPDALGRQWQDNLLKIREVIEPIEPWRNHPWWLIVDFNTIQAKCQDVRSIRVDLAKGDPAPNADSESPDETSMSESVKKWGKTRWKHLYALQCHVIAAQSRNEEASKKRRDGIKKSNLAKFILAQTGYPSEVGRLSDWRELLQQTPAEVYKAGERSIAPVFFPGVSVRDIIGQLSLQSRPFLPFSEYTRSAAPGVSKFVGRLLERKEGILSLLRDGAGAGIDHDVKFFDLFTGIWWPVRQVYSTAPRRHVAWLVCKLYGRTPLAHRSGCHLPKQLACAALHLKKVNPKHGHDIKESIIDRFDLLLNTPVEQLEPELQWALSTVADALDSPGVDWEKLIDHLSVWHRHSVRLFWAQQFADVLTGSTRYAEPAEEDPEAVVETGS